MELGRRVPHSWRAWAKWAEHAGPAAECGPHAAATATGPAAQAITRAQETSANLVAAWGNCAPLALLGSKRVRPHVQSVDKEVAIGMKLEVRAFPSYTGTFICTHRTQKSSDTILCQHAAPLQAEALGGLLVWDR